MYLIHTDSHTHKIRYRTAGDFGGSNFGKLQIFSGWQILIWQIDGQVSLSMHIMNEFGEFNFGEW